MNILVAVEELRIGGAQTFALRLAQALQKSGNKVYLYSLYWQFIEHDLVQKLAPDVELVHYEPALKQADNLLMRAEGWWQRRGRAISLRTGYLHRHLLQVLREKNIEVVHSHTFKCDHLLALVLRALPKIPLVITMHGDYEDFLNRYRTRTGSSIPDYPRQLAETLERLDGIGYLSEQNLEVLTPAVSPGRQRPLQVQRIYNGLAAEFSSEASQFSRPALGISDKALVFGMVARGMPKKGWEPLIAAFKQLEAECARPIHLLLVGSSPFLSKLQQQYQADTAIHFLGFVSNPVDCVQTFDVGVLASSYQESLPNSIAEYLYCGKAVISTEVGEIAQMILAPNGQPAGLLVQFPQAGLTDSQQLYQAMKHYVTDPSLLVKHQQLARPAFQKFDMNVCIQAYTELYEQCRQQL